jgi:diphthamide synthase (EF-2-diphthine--ammonia ligase)
LHLEDIRKWRIDTFGEIETPLFGISYALLLERLWKARKDEGIEIVVSASSREDVAKVGESYDESFVERLKILNENKKGGDGCENVDLMGECGEFHTQVKFIDA